MAAFLLRFRLTRVDNGRAVLVLANEIDLMHAERAYDAPILTRAQEGYFEPIVQLAFQGAQRAGVISKTDTLDEFVSAFTIEMLEDGDTLDGDAVDGDGASDAQGEDLAG